MDLKDDQKQAFDRKTINEHINEHVTFIEKDNKLIYPELKINQRIISDTKSKSGGGKAPPKKVFSDIDLQTWYYNKVNQIHLFYFYIKLHFRMVIFIINKSIL